ncbi:ABC transporter permease [Aquisphaera insulae]|uniref:ABC transporter permease n=1 Tax=Aquisphaera insulae TaxID=2712864 RepID=UPI0013EDC498|nr:ABC transporter permease [Aquisphaera insulae]
MVDLAWKIVWHDKIRFLITVSGVGFAVALVFIQVGLFRGLLGNASVTIERASADLWVTARNAPNVDLTSTFPETHVERVRSVPGVARADNLIVWFSRVSQPDGATEEALLYALEDFSRWNLPWSIREGDADDLRRGKFVLLDDSATKRFRGFAAGDHREFYGQRLKVIGRTSGAVSFTTVPLAFVDYRLAQSMMPQELRGRTTYILVKLSPGADVVRAREEIRRRLPNNDVWTRDEWAARSRAYWTDTTGLGLNMLMTVALGGFVGVIVVAQTLYTSTGEHLGEFATVKAIGGRNADVLAVIAKQAVIAALVGFAMGAILAAAARPVVAALGLRLDLTPSFAAEVFLGTIGLCLVASSVSFRRVARLDPAMVFRI